MTVLCTICMRQGSKGLRNKNLICIKNKPLLYFTIQHAKRSKLFANIVVSTNSKKIQKLSKFYGAESWFLRSKKLSNDKAKKISAIKDVLLRSENFYKKNFNTIIDLDATSPLRDPSDIVKAYNLFKKTNADMLVSGCKSRKNPYFNMIEKKGYKLRTVKKLSKNIYTRQDAPKTFDLNGSIYIWNRNSLINSQSPNQGKTVFYEMPEHKSWDIDSKFDFEIVKYLLLKKMSNNKLKLF